MLRDNGVPPLGAHRRRRATAAARSTLARRPRHRRRRPRPAAAPGRIPLAGPGLDVRVAGALPLALADPLLAEPLGAGRRAAARQRHRARLAGRAAARRQRRRSPAARSSIPQTNIRLQNIALDAAPRGQRRACCAASAPRSPAGGAITAAGPGHARPPRLPGRPHRAAATTCATPTAPSSAPGSRASSRSTGRWSAAAGCSRAASTSAAPRSRSPRASAPTPQAALEQVDPRRTRRRRCRSRSTAPRSATPRPARERDRRRHRPRRAHQRPEPDLRARPRPRRRARRRAARPRHHHRHPAGRPVRPAPRPAPDPRPAHRLRRGLAAARRQPRPADPLRRRDPAPRTSPPSSPSTGRVSAPRDHLLLRAAAAAGRGAGAGALQPRHRRTSRPSSSPSSPPRRPSSPAAAAPGILSQLRGATGLDDLDIITEEDGATAVRAGKYLDDNIYLDVQTDTERRQPRRDQPRRQRQRHRPRLGRLRRQHHDRPLLRARLLSPRAAHGSELRLTRRDRRAAQYSRRNQSAIRGNRACSPLRARPRRRPRSPRSPLPAAADEVNIYSSRHYDTDERALQRLHRGDRHPGQPHRGHAGGADRPDAGRGRQQPGRHLPDRRRRPHLARRPGRACCSRSHSRGARRAHPRAPAPPRRPLVRLLAARADHLLRQGPGARTRRRPTRSWPTRPGRARSASARPRTSTTSR